MGHLRKIKRNKERLPRMIETTMGQLVAGSAAIQSLLAQKVTGKTALLLTRAAKQIEPELETYNKARLAVFEKYGDWNEARTEIKLREGEDTEKANQELREMWESNVTLAFNHLPLSLLDSINISAAELSTIEWLFAEE